MNYYIALVDEYGNDYGIMESTDKDYISKVFMDLVTPPAYSRMELRGTEEDLDTHLDYEIIREK